MTNVDSSSALFGRLHARIGICAVVLALALRQRAHMPRGQRRQVPPQQRAVQGPPLRSRPTPSEQLEQIVITGTHITSTSTFTTPTPVTVIDASTIQSLGLVSVNDIVNEIPQNSNFTSAANVGLGNFNIGAQFANLRGLNPFFGTRTLTLVDTQRVVPTSAGGAVDLNIVPSIMIKRVDVVTGGASAAYGSDAVAGVLNVILDNKFEGAKIQLDGGETTYHDGGDMHAALELGKAFFDGRVHEVFGAEYEDAQGIGRAPRCDRGVLRGGTSTPIQGTPCREGNRTTSLPRVRRTISPPPERWTRSVLWDTSASSTLPARRWCRSTPVCTVRDCHLRPLKTAVVQTITAG